MSYREVRPQEPALRAFVERLWTAARPAGAASRVLPDGCVDLVFEHDGSGWSAELVGAATRAHVLAPAAATRWCGVRFRPGGAAPLLSLPLGEVRDRAVPLRDVLPGAERLTAAIAGGGQRAFERLLLGAIRRDPDPGVQAAAQAIRRARGQVSIAHLADELGWTRQHLARRFRREVGVSPKAFARVARVQAVVERVRAGGEPDWAGLALDAGYCDQAHLAGEFKRLVGLTPTQFARAEQVPFLQDADPAGR